eukprot:TRINITY_DN2104_c0_g1_i1.p1 TRINITY_DN2104_c0_g1~~TRINITY_DN2104_c0_g1_i1.p1  ORF type:complete len:386 (+),score=61.92 TRINITY_DN2104_c0_g1_i1:96-1253(+)
MSAMWNCLVFTGILACGASTATFQIDDKVFSHVWRQKKAMPNKRSDLTATTVDDAIYLVGGCDSDQAWDSATTNYVCTGVTKTTIKYLPLADSYEPLQDAPRSRYRHAAAAVGSKVYVLGGCGMDDSIISEVDVFDTRSGEWSVLGPMPNATSDLSAFVHGGKIYALGGYNRPDYKASSAMMIFDPATADWSVGPSLAQGRGDAAAALAGGRAYALGGFHHDDFSSPMSHLEMLNPAKLGDGWSVRKSMSVARGDKAVAVLNGLIHVVGGETKNKDEHSVPLMDVEVYDASGDKWYNGGSIPSHRFRFVAAAHGSSIFIFGGQGALSGDHGASGSSYPVLNAVDEYQESAAKAVDASTAHATKMLNCVMLATFLFYFSSDLVGSS